MLEPILIHILNALTRLFCLIHAIKKVLLLVTRYLKKIAVSVVFDDLFLISSNETTYLLYLVKNKSDAIIF